MRYRYDIEGLRAVAVLAVVLYHFGVPGFDGGFIGVDVFFVISGFLITSLLINERDTSGHISIRRFYARRARRLLPISATVIVAAAVAGAVLLPATRLPDLAEEVTAAGMFGANVLFAQRGTDYLTAALAPSPLQHYWSLAVEEQFYVVWPALIAVVTVGARVARHRVAAAMTVIVLGSFALSTLLTPAQPSWSYFGLHTRAWELGVGALLAAVAVDVERIPARVRAVLGWAGLAGIALSTITYGQVTFPGWAAALPVLSTAAVLITGQRTKGGPGNLLLSEPLTYLGSRSYSLYLWHWPVIIVAEGHLARGLTWPERAVAAALAGGLAELGYRTIEHPIRSSRSLARRTGVSLTMGAGLVACSLLTGVLVASYHPSLSTGVVAAAPQLDPIGVADTPTTAPVLAGGGEPGSSPTVLPTTSTTQAPVPPPPIAMTGVSPPQAIVDALAVSVVPDNVRPPLMNAKNDVAQIYADDCHVYYDSEVSRDCVYGDPNGTVTVALWGDSHAAQWFPALQQTALAHHWRLLSLTQGGCPYLEIPVWNRSDAAEFRHCVPWRASVLAYMKEMSVDVVFVSQHYGLRNASSREAISPAEWQAALPQVLSALAAADITPVVIADSPNPPEDVPQCVAENRRNISTCDAHLDDAGAAAIDDVLRATTAAAGVGLVEPNLWLCVSGTCPVVVGDLLVYRDGDHLTNTFVTWLAPVFETLVTEFVERTAALHP